jgi:hypothetical protein
MAALLRRGFLHLAREHVVDDIFDALRRGGCVPTFSFAAHRAAVGFGKVICRTTSVQPRKKECAAAGQDLAEHDLQDQQVTGRSANELAVAQASKGPSALA